MSREATNSLSPGSFSLITSFSHSDSTSNRTTERQRERGRVDETQNNRDKQTSRKGEEGEMGRERARGGVEERDEGREAGGGIYVPGIHEERCQILRGGGTQYMHSRSLDSHSCNIGTEHVGLSQTRQTSHAPSAKRREVFSEWHEGWAASYSKNRL